MKNRKEILIMITISLALLVLSISLIYFNKSLNINERAMAYLFLPLWTFSLPFSFVVWYRLINKLTFEQGLRLGVILGWSGFFIPILIAPFFMIKYVIDYFK